MTAAVRKMPAQKPGRSIQEVATPVDFLNAVQSRFGEFGWDLAASQDNTCAPDWFDKERDSLRQGWHQLPVQGRWLWLNPEFADINPWAEKCAAEMRLGARILLLTPASVGAKWFQKHVVPAAHVIELSDRIQFVGHTHPFPKDLCLSVFCAGLTGRSGWAWKRGWPEMVAAGRMAAE